VTGTLGEGVPVDRRGVAGSVAAMADPQPADTDRAVAGALDAASARAAVVDLARSARRAGRRAVVSGRWLADTVVEMAPRLPIRDAATLAAHHDGRTGAPLARALTKASGRVSAGIGAATGTAIAAQQLSVATVVLVPFELAAETALVVLTELKLVAELHEVAGRPLPGGRLGRSRAALLVWTSGHALPPGAAARPEPVTAGGDGEDGDGGGDSDDGVTFGPAARRRLAVALRARYTRNLATLGPLLTGAAAAGVLNRRSTVTLGHAVARDLGLRR
jgi:hypothetical protein